MLLSLSLPQPNKVSGSLLGKNLNDERGQVMFLGILLTMCFLLYFLFLIIKIQRHHLEIRNRLQTYQCFHSLDVETSNYIKRMGELNMAIFIAHKASLIPVTAPQGKATQQTLMAIQQILHVSYLKKLNQNSYCQFGQALSYVKNLPYKTLGGIVLQRSVDGTVDLKKKEWDTCVSGKKGIKPNTNLSGHYRIKTKFSSESSLEVKEEWPFSKACFGFFS